MCVGNASILVAASIFSPALANYPANEPSEYSPSLLLSQAARNYDVCVRAAARKYALQQEETAIIVQKAEQDCQRQLTELQEQGRADGAGLAPGIRNLGHEVEQFVNKSTAATRVSAFAEVGMVRDPPIRTP